MVSINSSYSTNMYATQYMNMGSSAIMQAMQGGDMNSIFANFLGCNIDMITNAAADNCSTDNGKALIGLLGSAVKMLLAYVIGSAGKEATSLHNDTETLANNGEAVNDAVVKGTYQEMTVTQKRIDDCQEKARNATTEMLNKSNDANDAIDQFEAEQTMNAAEIEELATRKRVLIQDNEKAQARITELQNEIDEHNRLEQELQTKKTELEQKEKQKQDLELKLTYTTDERERQNILAQIDALGIDALQTEVENISTTLQSMDISGHEAEIAQLNGDISSNQQKIVSCNNMIEVNVAQIEGQQEALVNYIEETKGMVEADRAAFEQAVNEINTSAEDYQTKVCLMEDNLQRFQIGVEGAERTKLAQQLVNGQTYQAMGAEAEAAADAESLTPLTAEAGAENRAKAVDLIQAARESNTYLSKDTQKVNKMLTSYLDDLTKMKNFKLKNITKIDPPVINFKSIPEFNQATTTVTTTDPVERKPRPYE